MTLARAIGQGSSLSDSFYYTTTEYHPRWPGMTWQTIPSGGIRKPFIQVGWTFGATYLKTDYANWCYYLDGHGNWHGWYAPSFSHFDDATHEYQYGSSMLVPEGWRCYWDNAFAGQYTVDLASSTGPGLEAALEINQNNSPTQTVIAYPVRHNVGVQYMGADELWRDPPHENYNYENTNGLQDTSLCTTRHYGVKVNVVNDLTMGTNANTACPTGAAW